MLEIIRVLLLICKSKVAKVIIDLLALFVVVFRIDNCFDNDSIKLDNNKV